MSYYDKKLTLFLRVRDIGECCLPISTQTAILFVCWALFPGHCLTGGICESVKVVLSHGGKSTRGRL